VTLRLATTLVAALALATAAAASAAPVRTGVVCPGVGAFVGGGGKVKPATIMLACGDGNFWISDLHWNGWGSATATATGEVHYNDCKPYCAAGHFHVIPGSATLTKLKAGTCQGAPARFYTRLHVVVGKKGKNIPPDVAENLPARC
jgi:hypothetical protein